MYCLFLYADLNMSDDKEELVLPGENVRPKGKIGIRHLVVFMGWCSLLIGINQIMLIFDKNNGASNALRKDELK